MSRPAAVAHHRQRRTVALGVLVAVTSTGCAFVHSVGSIDAELDSTNVSAVAGWTRMATTKSFIVVANVLPGEQMFTPQQAATEHPTQGEIALDGGGTPTGPDVRHIEAHIYDRATGIALTDVDVTIEVVNRTTGERTTVSSVIMHDVIIGDADIHYGNNVRVPGGIELGIEITVDDEEVTFDGHLD